MTRGWLLALGRHLDVVPLPGRPLPSQRPHPHPDHKAALLPPAGSGIELVAETAQQLALRSLRHGGNDGILETPPGLIGGAEEMVGRGDVALGGVKGDYICLLTICRSAAYDVVRAAPGPSAAATAGMPDLRSPDSLSLPPAGGAHRARTGGARPTKSRQRHRGSHERCVTRTHWVCSDLSPYEGPH
jgi:hypothetical protein